MLYFLNRAKKLAPVSRNAEPVQFYDQLGLMNFHVNRKNVVIKLLSVLTGAEHSIVVK